LVDVTAATHGNLVRKKLERDSEDDRRGQLGRLGDLQQDIRPFVED
jgi:hypothetical protein